MKTTIFFNEIKETVNCALKTVFDYSVNPDKDFFEIILDSEPMEELKDICEKNGFGIKKNMLHINEGGKMISKNIWEVKPIDANDIEFVEVCE